VDVDTLIYVGSMTVRLGVDFGTSTTVAMLSRRPGLVMPLLFDGSPLLPSAVYAAESGDLVVGQDAWRSARIAPARFEQIRSSASARAVCCLASGRCR
jgi:molecular chaperone DnaK (HSP70)